MAREGMIRQVDNSPLPSSRQKILIVTHLMMTLPDVIELFNNRDQNLLSNLQWLWHLVSQNSPEEKTIHTRSSI
jgi:hypothetical protein